MFKTDLTDDEVSEAANKLIKNYICNFYEIQAEHIFEIIDFDNKCIYCDDDVDIIDNIIIDTNNIKIGYFCSKLCKSIYYSIIKSTFNLHIDNIINFIPYFLLSDKSKKKYKNIKNIINNYEYDNLSVLSKYKKNNIIYCNFILLINNKFINFNEYFDYISDYKNCIYCNSSSINNNIILEHKTGIINGFCSKLCRDSISKQIYTTLFPIYKYNAYLIPFELIKNKKDFLNCIESVKNNDNLYGGYYPLNNTKIKIELFTTN
ncbi:VLTF-2 late transcription factor 2 [Choristoneura rosaceana entomopoxvirus 'L']|uniref:VLTF-2 late transcription factor 2 n=1 Tax=Choristoneura rosaceana entomopoxvirus 'L' TaxID=1293539 RepID=A0ABM9QK92_9POXV|nr:VLTF-2 late transcription factor 2 [Choristoneura rosaceana entomopoxvirus 'L']CCU55958.1 VLTF-2 late transcription factor 2 [Choristoneura rosaceana entomopoxvirus 'L']